MTETFKEITDVIDKYMGKRVIFDNSKNPIGSFVVKKVSVSLDIEEGKNELRFLLCDAADNCFRAEHCELKL